MNGDQIADRWRMNLVRKLQDRFGLSEEEAIQKVQTWLDWLQAQPETPISRKPSPAANPGSSGTATS